MRRAKPVLVITQGEGDKSDRKLQLHRPAGQQASEPSAQEERRVREAIAKGLGGPKPTHRLAPAVRQDTKNRLWRPKEREKAIDIEAELRTKPCVKSKGKKKGKENKKRKREKKDEEARKSQE